jgi:TonB-linked SusC/RagA family outer membrane protein
MNKEWVLKYFSAKGLCLLVIALCSTFMAFSQETIPISGNVVDSADNSLLNGVSVLVEGTTQGTITDAEGKYTITASSNSTLVFRRIGYSQKEVSVDNRRTINISLSSSNQKLNQIVVVGYGTQKKSSVTAAISTLKGDEIASTPITNLSNGFVGRMSGIIFRQGSGEPGADASNIYIRGISTTGSTQPLVVVDGIPRDFQDLDPNTIETITVLKDAAAVAPYGVAGANGVILVTTKRGKTGTPSLTYNGYIGFQNPTVLPSYVNSFQYASLRNAASINEGNPPRFSDYALQKYKDGSDPDAYANSNATKDLIERNTPLTSHNIEMSGGTDRIKYYASLGYMSEAGIWKPTYQRRYNLDLKLDAKVTKTTDVSLGLNGRKQKNTYPPVGSSRIFELIKYALPINPVRYSNGFNAAFPYGSIYGSGYSERNTSQIFTQLSLKQDIPFIPGLNVTGTVAYDPTVILYKTWITPVHMWSIDTTKKPYQYIDGIFGQDKPSLSQSISKAEQLTFQASLNYSMKLGKSNIGALVLFESKSNDYMNFGASRVNYNLNLDELDLGSSSQADISNSGSASQSRQMGLVYRLTYDYGGKYLLEASGRYDGSYYFAKGHRFGFFPAFSLGWRLSEEDFIKQNFIWIDNLKIRGSYGETGALAGGPFQYLSTYNVYGPAYVIEGDAVQGISERIEANPNITWERARKSDIGLEASFWKGLLSIEADYFHEKRSNMLFFPNVIVPVEYGIGLSQVNAGVMKNQGIDFSVGSTYNVSKDMQISLNGNFTYAKNTLLRVFETNTTYDNPRRRRTGKPLGSQFGFESLGFFQASDFNVDGSLKSGIASQPWGKVQPGDIRYKDINGDGEINNDDITQIGYALTPEIIYGVSPVIRYKGFTLNLLFQGATHTSFYGSSGYNWAFFNNMNVLVDNLDYWTPKNTDARNPRITNAPTPNNSQVSSFWMHDAGYLRLKSATFSYTINSKVLQQLKIKNARAFVSGQNLFTWTKIRNYDPEIINSGGLNYPLQKVISIGLNITL